MKLLSTILALVLTFQVFSFDEENVELEAEGCTLKGTLTTQDDPSKATPLVILIAGSGPTDRDGNNPSMKNNSLKMLSELIVENGFACLRYDKRAIGESKIENLTRETLKFDHFISDASAWVDKYSADVRFNKIILAGHSQGSLVALKAANDNENVGAVISLAGAGQPIQEILKWQLSRSLTPQLQGIVDAKLDTLASGDTLKAVPDFLASIMHPNIQPFLISWMKYDPGKEASSLKQPLLIINGTTDIQIRVSEAKLLHEKNPESKLVVIKHMNHILKFTKEKQMGPQLELYSDPEVPIHKKLAKPLVSFIQSL